MLHSRDKSPNMANLLSDWLSQELLRATQEAVEWKKAKLLAQKATKIKSEVKHEPGTFPSDDSDDEDERFQDDGSNIRVELTRPIGENSRLQILNVSAHAITSALPYISTDHTETK